MPRRNISTATFESMTQKSDKAFIPVLIDIRHSGIQWGDSAATYKQEDGHLRLICDTRGVMYKGDDNEAKWYAPCTFTFKPPKEDGKSKSNASVSISCIDTRLIEVIRLIEEDLTCSIVGMYVKIKNDDGTTKYMFSKLYGKEFYMGSVTWNGISAQWELDPDQIADLSAPRDKGSNFRLPSIMEDN